MRDTLLAHGPLLTCPATDAVEAWLEVWTTVSPGRAIVFEDQSVASTTHNHWLDWSGIDGEEEGRGGWSLRIGSDLM